jgi:hypothetical protein
LLRGLPEVVVAQSAGFGFCRELADQSRFRGCHIDLGRMRAGILAFRNLTVPKENVDTQIMPYAPQTEFRERAQRIGFEEKTPVVVRFPGGIRCSAQLQVISVTGGLLCLQRPVQPGAVGKLMFLSNNGCIAGEAQMLTPVAWDRQPFKFTTLLEQDHYRLQTIIKRQLSTNHRKGEERRSDNSDIERLRPW